VWLPTGALDSIRRQVQSSVQRAVDGQLVPEETWSEPAGDPGLFGPGSVTWTVHADLPAMLVGGLSALLLQTLHPLAMAGVADHSSFRQDPLGRLRRTAAFVGVTTFGSTSAAERAIAAVRRVHRAVHGTAPDGRPYDANDPDLLTWVHTAEVSSFLRAYRRYGPRWLGAAHVDRYFAETAVVARALGARAVPQSAAEVRAYLRQVRPQLVAGPQALAAAAFVVNGPGPAAFGQPLEDVGRGVLVQAAIDLLPRWARAELRLREPLPGERFTLHRALNAAFAALRLMLGPNEVVQAAMARARSTDPDQLGVTA